MGDTHLGECSYCGAENTDLADYQEKATCVDCLTNINEIVIYSRAFIAAAQELLKGHKYCIEISNLVALLKATGHEQHISDKYILSNLGIQ